MIIIKLFHLSECCSRSGYAHLPAAFQRRLIVADQEEFLHRYEIHISSRG
jgi:hypothetical protein